MRSGVERHFRRGAGQVAQPAGPTPARGGPAAMRFEGGVPPPVSDRSPFAPVADGHAIAFDDDRHFALPFGKREHLFQGVGIVDDADIVDRLGFRGESLTGCAGVRSCVFPVNRHSGTHSQLPG